MNADWRNFIEENEDMLYMQTMICKLWPLMMMS